MLKQIVHKAVDAAIRLSGWHSNEKLILFLSDDWGCIRVPGRDGRAALQAEGLTMETNRFDRFDCIESELDMEELFAVLRRHPDRAGRLPVITAVANLANPDFDRVRATDYQSYFYKTIAETWAAHPGSEQAGDWYRKGIAEGIFVPEYHGREHLQVQRWLRALQLGDQASLAAFRHRFFFVEDDALRLVPPYYAAFDLDSTEELETQKAIVRDGIRLFVETFGYQPTLFTPPATLCHRDVCLAAAEAGIRLLDLPRLQLEPRGRSRYRKIVRRMGAPFSGSRSRIISRNVVFEPNLDADSVQVCMGMMERAFDFRQPAIISNHRAAFTGGIDPRNRQQGLAALDRLLQSIRAKWPDAVFVTPAQLCARMGLPAATASNFSAL